MLSKVIMVSGIAALIAMSGPALAGPKSDPAGRNARESVVTYELNDEQIDSPGLSGLPTSADSKSADTRTDPAGTAAGRQLAETKPGPR